MSFFSWWTSRRAPALPPESSGLSRQEATRPAGKHTGNVNAGSNAHAANRKGERMAQRELLYAVVRDAMVRAGILSSSYKFKVLSLDSRGRQFMVMVDMAADQLGDILQLAEIEALIAQSAKSRHQIMVTAVYWRRNDHVAVGVPLPPESHVADGALAPAAAPVRAAFDPILPDEVQAFKRAMAAGPARPRSPQRRTLPTGFEDTELFDNRAIALSGSQHGDLN